MSKIICDVCGTRYPDSAEQCPICGRIRETGGKTAEDSFVMDEAQTDSKPRERGGHFSISNVRKRNREMPRYEMEEERNRTAVQEDEEEEFEELEGRGKSNVVINVLLVIVIVALLAVVGYIFMNYLLPNILPAAETIAATEQTEEQTEAPTETEEPTIPCTDLTLGESVILLERMGQEWLLNVSVMPEDTTDELVFTSSNDSIVSVDEEGKITAVGEGDVTITITCGDKMLNCTVACVFEEGGEEPTEETAGETTGEEATEATEGTEEDPAEATEGEEATEAPTEGPTEPLKNVTLTVKQSDVTFKVNGQQATFKLTCGLKATEVEWSSENEDICTVDENGIVTRTGKGTTNVVVKYGEQEVKIIVRCP